jgi:hypothetical protein
MSFDAELAKDHYQINIVIKIKDHYFSRFPIDSGLTIDAKYQCVGKCSINPAIVDIRSVRTTLSSLSFTLVDLDGAVSSLLSTEENSLMGDDVIMYQGFITGSFDWSDYQIISQGVINKINKKENIYNFKAKELMTKLNDDFYDHFDSLIVELTQGETTNIQLYDVGGFADSGKVEIDGEFINYTGRDLVNNYLTGLTRSDLNSTAKAHSIDTNVYRVDELEDNPFDILLKTMISPSGGGVYSVLDQGLNISQNEIDIAQIESIRDASFSGDQYRFYMHDVGNALKFYEREIMEATNCRFVNRDGLISIAELDQVIPGEIVPEINEQTIVGFPNWSKDSDRIINEIIINYNFNEGLNQYTRTDTYLDQNSIDTYNKKNRLNFSFKGIQSDLSGFAIVKSRAEKLLERLATPQTRIKIKTHFKNSNFNIGDKVNLIHRYLPSSSGLGIDDQIEILSRGIDLNSALVNFDLQYTSSFNLRFALIAPSPLIVSVTSQSIFEVPDGSAYRESYKISIDEEVKTIIDVTGNIITVDSDFITILDETKRVKFPPYDTPWSNTQKNKYIAISFNDNQNFPSDDSSPYLISF